MQAAGELGRYTVQQWIGEIDVPTSVLVHSRDQVVPPRRQLELASAVPNAVAHVVDADHFAVVRNPEPFVRALADAIREVTFAYASERAMPRAS